jgi:hypothetical protein
LCPIARPIWTGNRRALVVGVRALAMVTVNYLAAPKTN